MKLFKVTWSENGTERTYAVLVDDIESLVKRLDGFKLDNLISIEKIKVEGIDIISLRELNEK